LDEARAKHSALEERNNLLNGQATIDTLRAQTVKYVVSCWATKIDLPLAKSSS